VACLSEDDPGFSRKTVPNTAVDITSVNQVQIAGLYVPGGGSSNVSTGKGDVQVTDPSGSATANMKMLNNSINFKSIANSKKIDAAVPWINETSIVTWDTLAQAEPLI